MRGRKPTSTDLKILRGNPGRRPLNSAEPKYLAASPAKPTWLDEFASEEWDRLVKVMSEARLLTVADYGVLLSTCLAYAEMKRNTLALQQFKSDVYYTRNKRGDRTAKPRPEAIRSEAARRQYVSFLCELGQSPVSKTKVKAIPANTENPGLKELLG
jgi:P27 family predicted phage terminase small subunit